MYRRYLPEQRRREVVEQLFSAAYQESEGSVEPIHGVNAVAGAGDDALSEAPGIR